MNEIVINVKGMVCSGCENRIKNAINTLDNVESVTANHETGVVTVNTSLDKSIIEETIEDLGFDVVKDN